MAVRIGRPEAEVSTTAAWTHENGAKIRQTERKRCVSPYQLLHAANLDERCVVCAKGRNTPARPFAQHYGQPSINFI